MVLGVPWGAPGIPEGSLRRPWEPWELSKGSLERPWMVLGAPWELPGALGTLDRIQGGPERAQAGRERGPTGPGAIKQGNKQGQRTRKDLSRPGETARRIFFLLDLFFNIFFWTLKFYVWSILEP